MSKTGTKRRDHHYRAQIQWHGERGPTTSYKSYSREFRVSIPGKPSFQASADPAFRGAADLYNPEDLLLIALSSCHMLSYLALASLEHLEVLAYEDEAEGTMVQEGLRGRFSQVVLRPRVRVAPGVDVERALALHEDAHRTCFIANSVNFEIIHEALVVPENHAGAAAAHLDR